MAKLRSKHILLIICIAAAIVFGLIGGALADTGGHKHLSEACTAIAMVSCLLCGYIGAQALWHLSWSD